MLRERVVISEVAGREIPERKVVDYQPPPHEDKLRFSAGGCSMAPIQVFQFCAGCGLLYDCKVVPGFGRLCRICRDRRAGVRAAA